MEERSDQQYSAEQQQSTQQAPSNRIRIALAALLSLAVLIAAYFSSRFNELSAVINGGGLTLGILQWLLPPIILKGNLHPGRLKDFLVSLRKRAFLIYAVIVILLLLINPVLFFIKSPQPSPQPSPQVTITYPADGSKVGSFITVQGTASNIPAGKELWLFVTEEDVNGYFPQGDTKPITIFGGGTWSVGTHIGQENSSVSVGKKFTLIPALVDQNDKSAHAAIQAFFQQIGEYMPIYPLPSGIQLLPSQVHVIRI